MRIEHGTYSLLTKWLFVNLFLLLPLYGFTQLLQEDRLEIPISSDDEGFDIIPAKEAGLILQKRISTNRGDHLELVYLDTTLHQLWSGAVPIDPEMNIAKQCVVNGYLYLLLIDETFANRNFEIYRVDLKAGNYLRLFVRNSIPFVPIMFDITSVGAIMGGYFIRVPVVLFFEFSTQKSKILPGLFSESGELSEIKVNPDESFNVLISAKNYQKQKTLWVKNYDRTGKLLRNTMLLPEGGNHLIFGRTIQTSDHSQLIAGVYGSRSSELSRGLFIANIDSTGIQQVRYYSFGDLENFFKYMRAKQEQRVKNRIKRKKIKGKRIKFQYSFIVHEFIPYKNQFILLGEAFYKRYKNIPTQSPLATPYDVNRIFDGYQYTHAAVLGIAPNGNLLWDNSFEINDIKTFTLEQFVKMDARKEDIALLYLFDNKIRTKIIQDSTVLEGKTFSDLQLRSDEKFSPENTSSINKLEYWYKDRFLAYGIQDVVSGKSTRRKKKVFFVNKVSYN